MNCARLPFSHGSICFERFRISISKTGYAALILALLLTFAQSKAWGQDGRERSLWDLANGSRAEAGVGLLRWDAALAAAARAHAERMATEGPIAHRYGGELDLPERAGRAGARFSLIEENIAAGQSAAQIHEGWMHSPGHHDNLLNQKIDRIGVAVIEARGVLYAVADYAQGVAELSPAQVESKVGSMLRGQGVVLAADTADVGNARRYCAGEKTGTEGQRARFMMRWQSADIAKLPPELVRELSSGRYGAGSVAACAAQGEGVALSFTAYRVAVLLYLNNAGAR